VHRIGRTARAGASGKAIAFCDVEERTLLRDIERFIKQQIPVATDDDVGTTPIVSAPAVTAPRTPVFPGDSTRSRRSRRYRGARLY